MSDALKTRKTLMSGKFFASLCRPIALPNLNFVIAITSTDKKVGVWNALRHAVCWWPQYLAFRVTAITDTHASKANVPYISTHLTVYSLGLYVQQRDRHASGNLAKKQTPVCTAPVRFYTHVI